MGAGSWDERIMSFVSAHRSAGADHVSIWLMNAGNSTAAMVGLVLVALGVVIWRRWYRAGVAAAVSFVVAKVVADVLKEVFDRSRPPPDLSIITIAGPSFPSTHAATTSAVAAAVLLTVAWRTRGRAAVASSTLVTLVVLVGVCMVYLGGHWPSDVVVGWALGSVIGGCIGWVARPRDPARTLTRAA
jgi:membrane-associated phospholipid phosphatase